MGAWVPLYPRFRTSLYHWANISLSRHVMKRICKYCGKEYDAIRANRLYCSDVCRQRACRERQQEERKEALRAYKGRIPEQQRRAYTEPMSATDPRHRLAELKAHGLMSSEYWELYAEVDQIYYGGTGIVNGISTTEPLFVDLVLVSIEQTERIITSCAMPNKTG